MHNLGSVRQKDRLLITNVDVLINAYYGINQYTAGHIFRAFPLLGRESIRWRRRRQAGHKGYPPIFAGISYMMNRSRRTNHEAARGYIYAFNFKNTSIEAHPFGYARELGNMTKVGHTNSLITRLKSHKNQAIKMSRVYTGPSIILPCRTAGMARYLEDAVLSSLPNEDHATDWGFEWYYDSMGVLKALLWWSILARLLFPVNRLDLSSWCLYRYFSKYLGEDNVDAVVFGKSTNG